MNYLTPSTKEIKIVQISFLVIFLNFVVESFLMYFENRLNIFIFQYGINLSFYFYLIIKKFHVRLTKIYLPPILLTLYFLIMSIFSSNLLLSYHMVFKFSIPFVFFFIGYSLNSLYLFQYLVNRIWIVLGYFVVYFLIVNYFQIGEELYVGGVKVGFFSISGLYLPVFSIVVLMFFYPVINSKKNKFFTLVLSILTIAISVAILKRTLLLALFLGLFAYLIFNLNFKVILKISSFLLIVGLFFFYFFFEDFQKTLKSRESRFNKDYDISQEGRVTENFYVLDILGKDQIKMWFGSREIFNDQKYISYVYYEDERELHNSFARIFWNGGIFGLVVYLYFYWIQIKLMLASYLKVKGFSSYFKALFTFGITFLFLKFLNDFSSGATYLGFNAFCYLILGNILYHGSKIRNWNRIKIERQSPVITS